MKARRSSAALLFGASVLLHAGALVLLLGMLAPGPARHEAPAATLKVVWIRPPTAVPPAAAVAPVAAPLRRAPRRPRALPPAVARTQAPQVLAPAAPADAVAGPAPVFDHQGALAAARKLASEPDPARAGTLGAQLDARKALRETQDEKLGRSIASAKRSDCIKANGGGSLLTPLMWLLEKKGSGCKW